MEDRELVKMIKSLKIVQPNQDWVSLTRDNLFGVVKENKSSWFVAHWQPALTGMVLGLALVGGLLGLLHFGQDQVVVEEEPNFVAEKSPLIVLQEPLVGLKEQIVELKDQLTVTRDRRVENNKQALEIQQMIEDIRSLTENIEVIDKDKVLATLSDEIKEAGEDVKLAFLENGLNDLKEQAEKGLLTDEKMLELAAVKELYQAKDYEGAFWRLIELIN